MEKNDIINPFDFFDDVYCLNLPNAVAKKQKMQVQFKKVGLERVQFIHAPKPPRDFKSNLYNRNAAGEFGCSLSGCKAIIHGISKNAKNVLVFDDDVVFISQAKSVLEKALMQLKGKEWSVLYLGGNLLKRTKLSTPNLLKTSDKFDGSYAYCISKKYLLDFVNFWMYGITHGLYIGKKGSWSPYDVILSHFAKKTKVSYCVYPTIVQPGSGMSDVDNKFHPSDNLRKRIENNWNRFLIK